MRAWLLGQRMVATAYMDKDMGRIFMEVFGTLYQNTAEWSEPCRNFQVAEINLRDVYERVRQQRVVGIPAWLAWSLSQGFFGNRLVRWLVNVTINR